MRVTDLMVGDWLKSVDYNSPFRITAIYNDVVQTQADYQSEIDGNWYSEAEIKDLVPIELTEEILAKNGFVGVELTDSYELNTDYYEIEVWNYSDGLWATRNDCNKFVMLPAINIQMSASTLLMAQSGPTPTPHG